MSEEVALDEFIKEDKKNQKKGSSNIGSSNNNNNSFKRNYNNNNNNNNSNGGNKNFIKRTNHNSIRPNNNNNNNRNNNYHNNKEDRFDSRNEFNDRAYPVKKLSKPISKRKDDNPNDHHYGSSSNTQNPPRQLQINATKKVTIPKKLYTVKVKNLPSTINSHEIYELASDKEQVKVDSINTTFNCNSDSKLIEAEISYYQLSDAQTFVQNYNEATLESQELQVFLIN